MSNRIHAVYWHFTPARWVLISAFFLAISAIACAENNCPWMNEATASDIVGVNVVGTYAAGLDKSARCTFAEESGQTGRTLQVIVENASDAHADYLLSLRTFCAIAKEPLMAVGNEAATCSILHRKTVTGERALGRVRNQVFIISLSTSIRNDPILTPGMLAMKIVTAAEQVAGNLF